MGTTVFAVILLLLEPVGAILDNLCASAHSTTVCFLNHATYLTITYFSSTTGTLKVERSGQEFTIQIAVTIKSGERQIILFEEN